MASQNQFAANFDALKKGGALPEIDPDHISDHVKQAINDLTAQQLADLIDLSKKTKSHLFLKDHATGMIVQGL